MTETLVIDLNDHTHAGVRVFAGRMRGQAVREKVDLDRFDEMRDVDVIVKVPEDTFAVNSSFFLGLFGGSIQTLGPEEFERRFTFTGQPLTRVRALALQRAAHSLLPADA